MPRSSPPDARARARRLADDPDAVAWSPVLEPGPGAAAGWPATPGPADVEPVEVASADARARDGADAGVDAADVAARFRSGALGAVAAAYATAHGHPVGADLDESPGLRRWAVTARAAGLVLAVLLAVGAAVVTVAVSRGAGAPSGRLAAAVDVPTPRASAEGGPAAAEATPTPGGAATSSAQVLVHVVGAVKRPGLVRLAAGARLEDAVKAAGGATSSAQLDAVNLAGVLADGEQVRIPAAGETAGPVAGASGSGASGSAAAPPGGDAPSAAPVDLNTADVSALDALPGVGPVLAQRIMDRRTQVGPFTSVDQLDEVSGIGPTLLARLRDLVRV